jgi:5-methylcytosine-specific restriction endonuclease McrBC regulatory subunit McrC
MQPERRTVSLSLTEGSIGEAVPAELADVLNRWGQPALERLGVSLAVGLPSGGELTWTARTSNLVGSAIVYSPELRLLLTVRPKLPTSHILEMISFVSQKNRDSRRLVSVPIGEGELTEYFALGLAEEIRRYLSRGLDRDYVFRIQTLRSRIRGQIAPHRYLQESLARGKPHELVCRTVDFTADLPHNRAIRSALDLLLRLARATGGSVAALTTSHATAALRVIGHVQGSRNPVREATAAISARGDPGLSRVLRMCLLFFRSRGQADDVGPEELPCGLVLDMAWLFERFVRALLATGLGPSAVPYKRTLVYGVDGLHSSIELDGLVELSDRRVVVECKYRRVVDSLGDIMRDRWSSAHVYQAVAYATHRDVNASDAVLVFPHVGLVDHVVEHARIDAFSRAALGVRLRVWSVALDKPPAQTAEALVLRTRGLQA